MCVCERGGGGAEAAAHAPPPPPTPPCSVRAEEDVTTAHYEKVQQLQRLFFRHIPKLRELALANCGTGACGSGSVFVGLPPPPFLAPKHNT